VFRGLASTSVRLLLKIFQVSFRRLRVVLVPGKVDVIVLASTLAVQFPVVMVLPLKAWTIPFSKNWNSKGANSSETSVPASENCVTSHLPLVTASTIIFCSIFSFEQLLKRKDNIRKIIGIK